MPSPFPGMDPFIESQRWGGFHHLLIAELAQALVATLRPRYEVDPEERIYVETSSGDRDMYRSDVAVSKREVPGTTTGHSTVALDIEPTVYTLPMPTEEREPYLVIRKTGEREVVTVIEILSPTNKRPGSDGRREYLAKRNALLRSTTHLVEIDLLLGGERLPTLRPLKPATDYCAFVCRAFRRPRAEVYEWALQQPLPRIPIPLLPGDEDAILDLQRAIVSVYDRAGYDYALQYNEPLGSGFRPDQESWLRQVLTARSSG